MKRGIGGVEVELQALTSALDGSEWSALRPSPFTPGERAPRTHWIGGWVTRPKPPDVFRITLDTGTCTKSYWAHFILVLMAPI